jgi:LytS/YehU family sensor histidine kinase
LIRQALDNSGRKSITIEEEITFLKSYIEIEANRFEDKFTYKINVGNDIESSLLQIPPMLVQPFVENAINHGLLHKKNGTGKLEIDFSLSEQMLKIMISDNGIGRLASKSFSGYQELLHVSKGIALTEMRISRLNFSETNKIKLTIEDKYDIKGNAIGTQVELMIPLIFNN